MPMKRHDYSFVFPEEGDVLFFDHVIFGGLKYIGERRVSEGFFSKIFEINPSSSLYSMKVFPSVKFFHSE